MLKHALSKSLVVLIVLSLLLLSGCGNRYAEDTQDLKQKVSASLVMLKKKLDAGQLRNSAIAKTYAKQLSIKKPELKDVATLLAKDATSEGIGYTSMTFRLDKVALTPTTEQAYRTGIAELQSIEAGADPIIFNESLIDIVNTLADLSEGQLARLNIPKDATNAAATTPASYLVGNENYGQWRQDSSGNSFWAFYGQYALISSLLSPSYGYHRGPIYRDDWYSRPRNSYYNDYGRNTYGSTKQQANWKTYTNTRAKQGKPVATTNKDYRSNAAAKRTSTYSKMGSKKYGAKTAHSSGSSKSSTPARRSSSYGSFGSSSRGTSSGSRSFRGGK